MVRQKRQKRESMNNTASGTNTGLPRVFLDTNILLDYLLFRSERTLAVEYLFNVCRQDTIECYIAAHSLTNLFYIMRTDLSAAKRTQIVLNFADMCHVQEISSETIARAAAGTYSDDLEDALQIQCAVDCKADYILTRDTEGFNKCPIKVLAPHSLIHELNL